ncbi:MAG TPA: hypothetical protein VMW91_04915 [Desulfosporosinus sp.]|nr:hypothetical protein [Desulfosporosinus sp.]
MIKKRYHEYIKSVWHVILVEVALLAWFGISIYSYSVGGDEIFLVPIFFSAIFSITIGYELFKLQTGLKD